MNPHYSYTVADALRDATLPGYTAFTYQDVETAIELLLRQGYLARIKDADQSDADGQYIVEHPGQFKSLHTQFPITKVAQSGVVVEANIDSPTTLSIGTVYIAGRYYSYYGTQQNVIHDGRKVYGGTTLTLFNGDLEMLTRYVGNNPQLKKAVEQAQTVHSLYSHYDPLISRGNYDVVVGDNLSGVTDQSLRVGGATPAELVAIEALNTNPNLTYVTSQVALEYNPRTQVDKHAAVFLDHPTLRILASIIGAE